MQKIYFILLILILSSCDKDITIADKFFSLKSRPEEVAYNIKTIYSDSAIVYFTMESTKMESVRNKEQNELRYSEGVKFTFLDQSEKPTSWLTADEATNDLKTNKFIIDGNVKFFNDRNDKLQTSQLIWDSKAEILYTNKFVRITQPVRGDTVYGYGFRSNKDFTEFEIMKKFSGRIFEEMLSDLY